MLVQKLEKFDKPKNSGAVLNSTLHRSVYTWLNYLSRDVSEWHVLAFVIVDSQTPNKAPDPTAHHLYDPRAPDSNTITAHCIHY